MQIDIAMHSGDCKYIWELIYRESSLKMGDSHSCSVQNILMSETHHVRIYMDFGSRYFTFQFDVANKPVIRLRSKYKL